MPTQVLRQGGMLDQRIAGSYIASTKCAVVLMMREHCVVVEVPFRSDRAEQVTHQMSSVGKRNGQYVSEWSARQ